MLDKLVGDIADIVSAVGCVKLHDRCSRTEVALLKVDIKYARIGHYVEIIAKVADIGKRTPLRRRHVGLSLYKVGVGNRHIEQY